MGDQNADGAVDFARFDPPGVYSGPMTAPTLLSDLAWDESFRLDHLENQIATNGRALTTDFEAGISLVHNILFHRAGGLLTGEFAARWPATNANIVVNDEMTMATVTAPTYAGLAILQLPE